MLFLFVESVGCKPCVQRFKKRRAKRRAKRNKDVPSFCYIFQIWGISIVAICAFYYVNYAREILNLKGSIDRSYVGYFEIRDEAFENMTAASDAEARKMMYDEWTCDESKMRISPIETCASPGPQGGRATRTEQAEGGHICQAQKEKGHGSKEHSLSHPPA
jgi:hypothetical protein